MSVSIYSISKRFRELFRYHIKKQCKVSFSSLMGLIKESLGNNQKEDSRFPRNAFMFFYMILDYPVRFSWCLEKDFREVYLNARTDIDVEVFAQGEGWLKNDHQNLNKTYILLNKCVPLAKFYISPQSISQFNEEEFYRNVIKRKSDDILNQYLDYLIACVLVQPVIPDEFKEVVIDHYRRIIPHHKLCHFHQNFLSQLPRHKHPRRIPKVYSAHLSDFNTYKYLENPYFVTTWDEKEGFQDKWMFFGDLLKEAEKIKNGPHPCSDYLQQYPELNKMLDIDELWIYDLWQKDVGYHSLDYLKKDWFDKQGLNDSFLNEFQGDNYRIKTSEELIAQELESEPPENLVNDGFDGETMTTYADRQEMHINYLKHISNIPKTVWGYKKEPCPISDIWFKMHGYTD